LSDEEFAGLVGANGRRQTIERVDAPAAALDEAFPDLPRATDQATHGVVAQLLFGREPRSPVLGLGNVDGPHVAGGTESLHEQIPRPLHVDPRARLGAGHGEDEQVDEFLELRLVGGACRGQPDFSQLGVQVIAHIS
jgi:hypothetical protein